MEFHLQKGMIDTHFHGLIMAKKEIDTRKVLQASFESGLEYGVDIGTHLDDLPDRFTMMEGFDNILFSAGSYPSEVGKDSSTNLADALDKAILKYNYNKDDKPKIAAVGEIGLDWHWNYGTKKQQLELLEAQIDIANKHNLPVLLHNREADMDMINMLKAAPPVSGGIMHCFSSDYETAIKCIDSGLSISFAGNVTYKKNQELRHTAARIPLESIFMETDSPYLSPQKLRGKPNHPGHIGYTYETIAECQRISAGELIEAVKTNFLNLFRMD